MWKDLFSASSENYARFRPRYPDALFRYLSSLVVSHELAWDCATGNGQAALSLVSYFDQVIASDASREQIAKAPHHDKISYVVATAEQTKIAPKSVDLITVAQAFHWFDHEAFFAHVKEVLKPKGVLALWCYELCTINPPLDKIIDYLYRDLLGPYWEPERRFIEEGYQKNPFPLSEIMPPSFAIDTKFTLPQLLGYLSSWSPLKKYEDAHGHNALFKVASLLKDAWGDPEEEKSLHWPLHLRLGRL